MGVVAHFAFDPRVVAYNLIGEHRLSGQVAQSFLARKISTLRSLYFQTDALAAEAAQDFGDLIACLTGAVCNQSCGRIQPRFRLRHARSC